MTDTQLTAPQGPLATLLADPDRLRDVPMDTLERLYAMQQDMDRERARIAFNEAFSRVQAQMEPVRKLGRNEQTRSVFARAADVERMVDPLLRAEGITRSVSTVEPVVDGMMRVRLVLRLGSHEDCHYLDAPPDNVGAKGSATKTVLHGIGSTLTYIGRHLLCQVLGVQLYDDRDGNPVEPVVNVPITEDQVREIEDAYRALAKVRGVPVESIDRKPVLDLFKVDSLDRLMNADVPRVLKLLSTKIAQEAT